MYRLSKLRFVFPIGLFITFFLDGSFSKIFSGVFFSYPYSMVSHLVLLWLALGYFFQNDVHIPLTGFAVATGICFDLYYSGILGLYMVLFPLIVWLTRVIGQYFTPSFLTAFMVFFIDVAVFEFLNYAAYSVIGIASASFSSFVLYTLAPTLALNLIYFVVLYYPLYLLYSRYNEEARS
ncbi:rod shape-determining protein MreD [Paucilactobacillus suebicus]|uniref:Rod shape-determining protein MreD n=1 Tax=Paucilactobacillus suebicus DSM 5007 = KCTC 3549 TaxID=1423807 RepID=A0A0R1W713_9LACO|nr:rod shape-determining protein MreD [Paucilactobacillus suebicus]KRM13479.1 rod shape-determining protein MreD [Paucilactobacillus suebicus DSM 5007 = KCTC 3549]